MTSLLLLAGAAGVTPPPPLARTVQVRRRAPRAGMIPVVVGCVVLAALVFDRASLIIAASMVAATGVHVWDSRRQMREHTRRRDAAAAFLGHLATASEAGAPLVGALQRAVAQLPNNTPESLSRDVARMVHHTKAGTAFTPDTPELARVQALWSLASSHGIPVAQLITAARDELDHARRHRAATTAALAGPSTTATVLALLPVAGVLMGTAMGANPIGFLTGGGVGGILLVVGTALVCAGVLIARTIIQEAAS